MTKKKEHNPSIDIELQNWLKDFSSTHQRNLRVLHIGNIAGNAYINAKLQRKIGIDAFVIAEQDTYIMDTPEWEDVDFDADWIDDFNPNWKKVNLKGYTRPEWFITGGLRKCLIKTIETSSSIKLTPFKKYLLATKELQAFTAQIWKRILLVIIDLIKRIIISFVYFFILLIGALINAFKYLIFTWFKILVSTVYRFLKLLIECASFFISYFSIKINKIKIYNKYKTISGFFSKLNIKRDILYGSIKKLIFNLKKNLQVIYETRNNQYSNLIHTFKEAFPERKDQLMENDIIPFIPSNKIWKNIFSYFDVVQCYGAHPIWGLLSGAKYVALEHGTLRDFTLGDESLHRLIALSYNKAQHTFITNGDCLEYAKKINIKNYSAMIHPLDLTPFETVNDEDIANIRNCYEADILLFSPIRHDWEIKGTHIVIQSLPHILSKTDKKVVLLLCEWGKEIARSKQLIKELKMEEHVKWLRPLPKIKLAKHLKAADVILDQMTLPHFGGTAPQSLATGTPVIMSYKPESTQWMFREPAPILPAFNAKEISDQVIKALDPKWREKFKEQAKQWIDKYHSPSFLLNEHLKVYKSMVSSQVILSK